MPPNKDKANKDRSAPPAPASSPGSVSETAPASSPPSVSETALGSGGRAEMRRDFSSDQDQDQVRSGGENQASRRRRRRQHEDEDTGSDGDDENDAGDAGAESGSTTSSDDDVGSRRKRTRLSIATGAWSGSPVGSIDSPRQLVHHLSPRGNRRDSSFGFGITDSDGAP